MNQEWMNAKQVYDAYGIVRSVLGQMAEAGKVSKKVIHNDFGVLNLNRVADLENVINGGSDHADAE